MHYFKFNIGDYASHTRHLSPIEDIAYRRLLDLAYTSEKPITDDIRELSRLINMRDYQTEIVDILNEYWEHVTEGWINNRVFKELETTGIKSESAARSAKMRWDKVKEANAMRLESECNANASKSNANASKVDATHNPLPITKYPLPNTKDYPDGFIKFWEEWPSSKRKGGKSECLKSWKLKKLEFIYSEIIAHVIYCKGNGVWKDPQFIEAPIVYLNQAKWDGADIKNNTNEKLTCPDGFPFSEWMKSTPSEKQSIIGRHNVKAG